MREGLWERVVIGTPLRAGSSHPGVQVGSRPVLVHLQQLPPHVQRQLHVAGLCVQRRLQHTQRRSHVTHRAVRIPQHAQRAKVPALLCQALIHRHVAGRVAQLLQVDGCCLHLRNHAPRGAGGDVLQRCQCRGGVATCEGHTCRLQQEEWAQQWGSSGAVDGTCRGSMLVLRSEQTGKLDGELDVVTLLQQGPGTTVYNRMWQLYFGWCTQQYLWSPCVSVARIAVSSAVTASSTLPCAAVTVARAT